MASFSNFVGLNLSDDIADPNTARSIVRMIEGLRRQIINLNLEGMFTSFKQHSLDTTNPHKITFDDFPAELIEALFPLYQALPGASLNHDAFVAYMRQNPTVMFELIRRLVLNGYQYVDGVGSVPGESYDATNLDVDDTPSFPTFHAGSNCLDLFMTPGTFLGQSVLTRQFNGVSGNMSVSGSTTGTDYQNVVYINSSSTSNTIMVQIRNNVVTVQTYIGGIATGIISISGTTNFPRGVIAGYSPVILNAARPKFVITLKSGLLSIYIQYSDLDVDSISFIIPDTFMGAVFDTIYMSQKGYRNRKKSDADGFSSLSIYPQYLTPSEVNFVFETL